MLSVKKRAATECNCLTIQQYDAFQQPRDQTNLPLMSLELRRKRFGHAADKHNTNFHHHQKNHTSHSPNSNLEVAIYLSIIKNITPKRQKYTFISRNMKQSEQYGTKLHCHSHKLYVQTDSCKLCNIKLNDTGSGFCSNRAVGHTNDRLPGIQYFI